MSIIAVINIGSLTAGTVLVYPSPFIFSFQYRAQRGERIERLGGEMLYSSLYHTNGMTFHRIFLLYAA